ncbi:hypothetical protein L6R52_04145 [Myxococcota bacterium]|nr:hypothetical protein [Myxococcota bacterium]
MGPEISTRDRRSDRAALGRDRSIAAALVLVPLAVTIALAVAGTARDAGAHAGGLAQAVLSNPRGVGEEIADESFTFLWMDSDRPVPTGTTTIDFYYTAVNPPTFTAGEIPPTITGTAIVRGVWERDTTNQHTWDTSSVPTGNYWIWSFVDDPPGEVGAVEVLTFSPGLVSIQHPGDPVPPAVIVTKPDSPFRWADAYFDIGYSAYDPDGTGRVRLEATRELDGSNLVVIADDLPAVPNGRFFWETYDLAEDDWLVRATITDDRGYSFSAWSRYFVLVTHVSRPVPDAGIHADAAVDAGVPASADAGENPGAELPSSCACTRRPGGAIAAALVVPALALVVARRPPKRRRGP